MELTQMSRYGMTLRLTDPTDFRRQRLRLSTNGSGIKMILDSPKKKERMEQKTQKRQEITHRNGCKKHPFSLSIHTNILS